MKGASVYNNSRSQSQVLSFVSRQRTDTGILKRRKFFDTFKVSRQMTPIYSLWGHQNLLSAYGL